MCVPAIASAEPAPVVLERPLARAVEQRLSRANASAPARLAQASDTAGATSDKAPFFKSPKGVAVILLMAVGTGYAIYSAHSERISNPIR